MSSELLYPVAAVSAAVIMTVCLFWFGRHIIAGWFREVWSLVTTGQWTWQRPKTGRLVVTIHGDTSAYASAMQLTVDRVSQFARELDGIKARDQVVWEAQRREDSLDSPLLQPWFRRR